MRAARKQPKSPASAAARPEPAVTGAGLAWKGCPCEPGVDPLALREVNKVESEDISKTGLAVRVADAGPGFALGDFLLLSFVASLLLPPLT